MDVHYSRSSVQAMPNMLGTRPSISVCVPISEKMLTISGIGPDMQGQEETGPYVSEANIPTRTRLFATILAPQSSQQAPRHLHGNRVLITGLNNQPPEPWLPENSIMGLIAQ